MHSAIDLLIHVEITTLNARVSALSSLVSFSTMLVHDISQPLQALERSLYDLQSKSKMPSQALLESGIDALTKMLAVIEKVMTGNPERPAPTGRRADQAL